MSTCRPHLMLLAAVANLGIAAFAAAADAPAQPVTPTSGLTIPLGPPQASVPISSPINRNAFPADILLRMRAALKAQADNPLSRSRGND